ncbi:MAG: ABC transporter ATP-binding protein [Planctomycetia bacterium]|nr:ABC transporter ATP-binding protein [Planctomycetia bacterium]
MSSTLADLYVNDISKSFSGPEGMIQILKSFSFQLTSGESLAVVGPSGSGKSTLLSILGTLEKPDSGEIRFRDLSYADFTPEKAAVFRRDYIGFVFQNHLLFPQCTALENVLLPFLADRKVSDEEIRRGEFLLDKVGLNARRDHYPYALSGGECQRIALARALVRSPHILLADEPTGSLDRQHADRVAELLFQIAKEENKILIFATHDSLIADRADHILTLG